MNTTQVNSLTLPSYAVCHSDETGFVGLAEFVAMAINYDIEQSMANWVPCDNFDGLYS